MLWFLTALFFIFFFQPILPCCSISSFLMASATTVAHICITQLDLFFFFEIHTKLCTSQLSFDAQRHVRFTVQNSTHHIPSQICVFLIKSMSLLSINDQAKNLRVFWIPFSVTCHQNLLTVPYITDLFLVLIITITLS